MHIRLLAGSLEPTAGSHIYNGELIRRLAARGHRVSVACFDSGHADWPAEIHRLPRYDWSQLPAAWRLAGPLQAVRARLQIASESLDRPDLVIGSEHLFLRGHARRFPGVPWFYLPHCLIVSHEIDSYGLGGLHGRLMRQAYVRQQKWALQHATATVRFNQFAADALRDAYGPRIVRSPFLINPPGVHHPDDVDGLTARTSGQLRMLFVGRLVPPKNLDLVLQSLAAHRDAPWTLDILGDGSHRAELERISQHLGLSDRVRFHGHQNNLDPWYRNADLLVFPSKLESLGLVVVEAMTRGVPPLVIRNDGETYRVPFAEFIEDGVSGLVARDESDFRERLAAAIADPASITRMRTPARTAAREKFDWERHLDRYEEAFASALESPVGVPALAGLPSS